MTTIGKLKEKLVIESNKTITVIPAGTIIEISTEDEYPHTISQKQLEEAIEYLEKI